MTTYRLSAWMLGFVLAIGTAASADPISFDPDGTGALPASTVVAFDFLPGNVLAENVPATSSGAFTIHYQTRLGALLDAGSQPIAVPGLNSTFEITVVSQFKVSFNVVGNTIEFGPAMPATSFVRMFYDDNLTDDPSGQGADDLAGTGFFDGTLIFDSSVGGNTGGDVSAAPLPPVHLDLFSANDHPAEWTLLSGGEVIVRADASFVDADFFQTPGLMSIVIDSSLASPFQQVDPSLQFGDGTISPDLAPVNGNGEDIQLQTDGTATFLIPEPTTVGLIGIAILALVGRRQRQN